MEVKKVECTGKCYFVLLLALGHADEKLDCVMLDML